MQFLQEGDIIELNPTHKVYMRMEVPVYGGGTHVMSDVTHPTKGRYLVVKTRTEGGGYAHGRHDTYPDGHHVYCVKLYGDKLTKVEVDFYQSGCFTAMITDIQPVARAEKTWKF